MNIELEKIKDQINFIRYKTLMKVDTTPIMTTEIHYVPRKKY